MLLFTPLNGWIPMCRIKFNSIQKKLYQIVRTEKNLIALSNHKREITQKKDIWNCKEWKMSKMEVDKYKYGNRYKVSSEIAGTH